MWRKYCSMIKTIKQLRMIPEIGSCKREKIIIQHHLMKKKNAFTNVVTAECDAYAFYSVPYDQFWHVTVNGKKTKTYDVNGLTAVPVVKGENSIEFRYIYAPLKWAL